MDRILKADDGSQCPPLRLLQPSFTKEENIFWMDGKVETIGIDTTQAKLLRDSLIDFIKKSKE